MKKNKKGKESCLQQRNQSLKKDFGTKKLEHLLRERVKELSCLYSIANLIERAGSSIDGIIQGTIDLIPPSWQYPEITCARAFLESSSFESVNFKTSRWKQTSDIVINGEKIGSINVYYHEERPDIDEGPFLKEERLLIDTISERLGRACERIKAESQLQAEQMALKNKNIALREVLARLQEEKKEIGDTVIANVDRIIMPIVHELENQIPTESHPLFDQFKGSLKEITSPFINKISKNMMSLTPVEIQICNMIKNGLRTKEISKLRHISSATVSRHRERIRKKLKITNKATNLATYLQRISDE